MAPIILYSLLSVLLLLFTYHLLLSKKPPTNLPPSPTSLPILGHLLHLSSLPHRSLSLLSLRFGPLLLLRLGQVPVLIASSPSAARSILKTHDQAFSSRPSSRAMSLLVRGRNVSFSPSGDYWRLARKMVITRLLNPKRVRSLRAVRAEEAALMVGRVAEGEVVNVSEVVYGYANGVVSRAAAGKGEEDEGRARRFREMLEDSSVLLRGLQVEDLFPAMGWVGKVTGMDAKLRRMGRRWDEFLSGILAEHEERGGGGGGGGGGGCRGVEEEEDFVDMLLALKREEGVNFVCSDNDIKAIVMDLIAAGTDTTYVTLEWAMSELIRNPRVMNKLQAEVRNITSPKPTVNEDDLDRMPYLKLVLKEVLRLHPPAPLLVMHESTADVTLLQGYLIPAKTRVLVNTWDIGRDDASWESPEEFRPERFDGNDVDFRGNDMQFIPFGAGRRMCPGMQFAVVAVELALANLVYHFDWGLPDGMEVEELDMGEAPGLTTPRKVALRLVPTCRRCLQ